MQAILFDFDGVLTIDKYGSDSILRYLGENTDVPIDVLKREYYKIHHMIYGKMTESVLESIEGVKTVRAYCFEDEDYKKTEEAILNDVNSWWKIQKFESMFSPLFELVYVFAYLHMYV